MKQVFFRVLAICFLSSAIMIECSMQKSVKNMRDLEIKIEELEKKVEILENSSK